MAHIAHISNLLGELIESITQYSLTDDKRAFGSCKDAAQKALKNHRFGRTNQFHVQSSLNGLIEKFQILNKDALADALGSRLDELKAWEGKLKPEILSLLLHLSDRPSEKSDVKKLDALKGSPPPAPLTWEDIIADDPLEGDIWKDEEYSSISSDEIESDSQSQDLSEHTGETALSGERDTTSSGLNGLFLDEPDTTRLDSLQEARKWTCKSQGQGGVYVSEYQLIRESLNVLRGLPTSLVETHWRTGEQVLRKDLNNEHLSTNVLHGILDSYRDISSKLQDLRLYISRRHYASIAQTLAFEIGLHMRDFDNFLDSIDHELVAPVRAPVISLLQLHSDVGENVEVLLGFRDFIFELEDFTTEQSYLTLDLLYERTCLYENMLDEKLYEAFAKAFCACLKTFLRPIRDWMEQGETDQDDSFQLIRQNAEEVMLSFFWTSRYHLAFYDDQPAAPKFLQAMVSDIYSSGKVVAFLKELGLGMDLSSINHVREPDLSFESLVQTSSADNGLVPFSDRLFRGLAAWIESKHYQTSSLLQQQLFYKYGLFDTLDALGLLYLSANGSLFQTFASAIFAKMDAGKASWNDEFFLEDLLCTTFGPERCVQVSGISVVPLYQVNHRRVKPGTVKALSTIVFNYRSTWPIENIIPFDSLAVYQSVFILLLQITRAKALLSRKFLLNPQAPAAQSTAKAPLSPQLLSSALTATHSLRHRLLWLVTTLESFLLNNVILQLRRELNLTMRESTTIDGMRGAHARFIDRLERQCLLVRDVKGVLDAVLSVLEMCVVFVAQRDAWHREILAELAAAAAVRTTRAGSSQGEGGGGGGGGGGGKKEAVAASQQEQEQDSSDDEFYEAEEEPAPTAPLPLTKAATTPSLLTEKYISKIRQLLVQFSKLLAFATTGLQAASRGATTSTTAAISKYGAAVGEEEGGRGEEEEGEGAWETLVEQLEWGVADMKTSMTTMSLL